MKQDWIRPNCSIAPYTFSCRPVRWGSFEIPKSSQLRIIKFETPTQASKWQEEWLNLKIIFEFESKPIFNLNFNKESKLFKGDYNDSS